jgi:uncharacterized membrane protein YdbT with pleckstrin-like domain
MSYIEKNLLPGEAIVHKAHLHWARFAWADAWLGVVFFAEHDALRGFATMISLTLGILQFLNGKTSEFIVTNRRVYLKQGVLRTKSIELMLNKIESLQVEQGIFGRMLNFGSIIPGGSGGTKQVFAMVAKPMLFRQRVNEQIDLQRR